MLRACVLNIENLPDLEAKIDLKGASEGSYFEVHVRAQGELWANLLKQLSCIRLMSHYHTMQMFFHWESALEADQRGIEHLCRSVRMRQVRVEIDDHYQICLPTSGFHH